MKRLLYLLAIPILLSFTDWEPRADQYVTKDDVLQGYVLVADSFLIIQGDTLRPGELLHFSDTTSLLVTQHLLDSLLADYVAKDSTLLWDKDTTNELNTSVSFDSGTKTLTVTDAGGDKTAIIDFEAANKLNAFRDSTIITTNPISVTFPESFQTGYYLNVKAMYEKTIDGKNVRIDNAIYDFSKTQSGFSFSVDTIAGWVEWMAV